MTDWETFCCCEHSECLANCALTFAAGFGCLAVRRPICGSRASAAARESLQKLNGSDLPELERAQRWREKPSR